MKAAIASLCIVSLITILHLVQNSFRASLPEFKNIDIATILQDRYGFVNFQFLSLDFIEMTQSWICHAKSNPNLHKVLRQTIFITPDEETRNTMINFDSNLEIMTIPFKASNDMKYGDPSYYKFIAYRTEVIISFLKKGISVWITESDATWYDLPWKNINLDNLDFVVYDDNPPNRLPCGGLMFIRSNSLTIEAWENLLAWQKINVVTREAKGDSGNEQFYLQKLFKSIPELKVEWLPGKQYLPGKFFMETDESSTAIYAHNNWIVGTSAKIERAKKKGEWFLSETGKCI